MEKILIIDDEKPTLKMFSLFLSAYGYTVLTAENGEDGLEIFKREDPQLVLTDIKMPGMDGIEVLKSIKELNQRTEVIVITGHGDMDLAIKALNLDATDFINKPIQRQSLDQALKRAQERMRIARSKEEEVGVTKNNENFAVITVRGSVTSHSEPYLNEAFQEVMAGKAKRLILSFDENASINGAGIAVLTQIILSAKDDGREVAVAGLSENFRKVFGIVGISNMVTMFDDEIQAMGA